MQGGESKAKTGNQQLMDSKVKGTLYGGNHHQQVDGGGTPIASAAAGGPEQPQENGNRWESVAASLFLKKKKNSIWRPRNYPKRHFQDNFMSGQPFSPIFSL